MNLTDVLSNCGIDENASLFARRYAQNPEECVKRYTELVTRPKNNSQNIYTRKYNFTVSRDRKDGLFIIPYVSDPDSSLVSYGDPNHNLKKLPLIPFFREKSREDAIHYRATPQKKWNTSLSLAPLEGRFIGYDFRGIRDNNHVRTVNFYDAIIGKRLAKQREAEFSSTDYASNFCALQNGGIILAHVKSQSEFDSDGKPEKYRLEITSYPLVIHGKSTIDKHALWFDIDPKTHDCEKSIWRRVSYSRLVPILKHGTFVKRSSSDEIAFDQHVVCAIKQYDDVRSDSKIAVDPIIEFTKRGEDYFDKLRERTLMEVPDKTGKLRLFPLAQDNLSGLMYNFVKIYPQEAFFRGIK